MSYNERKPLEFFAFPFGEDFGNINSIFAMRVPTSPQSEGFYTHGRDYIHFPNFKYLHAFVIPKLIVGNKFSFEGGVGVFGGILLNKNQLIFGKEYFPWSRDFEQSPYYVRGDVRYYRYDFGWVADVSFFYKMGEKWKIGLGGKSCQSKVRMNDTFVAYSRYFDTRWIVYTFGLEAKYLISQ